MRNEAGLPEAADLVRRRGGLAVDVAAYIRGLVLTGTLRPGTKIDQEAICESLDVSRSPVREAIVVLGQEGLLDVTPRRGASVAELTPDDIIDHYALVGTVSGRAAAIAAEQLSDAAIERLAETHARFEQGSDLGPAELSELNDLFHQIINGCAPRRTRWLLRLLVRSVPANYYEFASGWDERAVQHHAVVLDAIRRRDADGARTAMQHHLDESGAAAVEALRSRGFWD
jgi:DNA-binding GntR family transcriptional regulator